MNIRCTQNIFPSAAGVNITYYILQPEDAEYRGIVQICHGMCEYFSRYTHFAKYLCSMGFVVCGCDQLGHGCSVPPAGEQGFFAHKDGWKALVADQNTLTDTIKQRYPGLPLYLLGHSMGSLISRLYLPHYGHKLAGCILAGTPGPNPLAAMGIYLSSSIVHSKGPMYRSALLNQMVFGRFNEKIDHPATPFDWLSRDADVVKLYQSDQKCNFIFTSSGFRDLFRLMQASSSPRCLKGTPRDLPLFFIAGDKDPVCDYGEGVKKLAALYHSVGMRDIEVVFYKNARHELLNEVNKAEVYGDILRWLEKHNSCVVKAQDNAAGQGDGA